MIRRTLISLHIRSLEITLTVPLNVKIDYIYTLYIFRNIIIFINFSFCLKFQNILKSIFNGFESSFNDSPVCILKGVFAKNERGYRLNAIKSAFDRY